MTKIILLSFKDHFLPRPYPISLCHKTMTKKFMKNLLKIGLLGLVIYGLSLSAMAQSYQLKSHKIEIRGMAKPEHAWTSKATKASLTADFVIEGNTFKELRKATLDITTKSIKSDKNSDLMDNRTYETLLADKYALIQYVLTSLKSVTAQGNESTLVLAGTLTMAGKSQPVELTMKGKILADGSIELKGSQALKMSSYGIKPPSFMLGALKVVDDVTIVYSVVLQK